MKTAPLRSAKDELLSATVRNFSGGWNSLDDDLNLDTKYATRLYNISPLGDGTLAVRYGTRLFTNAEAYLSSPAYPVNHVYFGAAVIAVFSNGDILRIFGDGSVARIWDSAIAGTLPGAPSGWGPTSFASFADFNNQLVIANGVDKPVTVASDLSVDYLQDLATSSNINTPIGKYVIKCGSYLVIAGDPVEPNRIHISAKDAPGTFVGDPPPNDATTIDVGGILPDATFIRGIAEFRGKLIIGFAEGTIIYNLGEYDSTGVDHLPKKDDTVSSYGTVSHRTMITYGDDMLMMDMVGVPSLKRTVFTGTIRPERVSDLIDKNITAMLASLSFESMEDRTFAVYNRNEGQFMFFIPNADAREDTTETKAFVFLYRPSLNLSAWARFDGWNFVSAARTADGNIVFADKDNKFWIYGSVRDPLYADFLDDVAINSGDGRAITFEWELPWTDINKRTMTKRSQIISIDSRGTGEFTVKMFVDRIMKNASLAETSLLTMNMTGGDSEGFGAGLGPFGGGRNTAYERDYKWPAKFKLMKLRISGNVTEKLSFVGISLHYLKGNKNR